MSWTTAPSLPLDALPPEMIEMILKSLEDSCDILNVFTVLPRFEGQIMKQRQEWLFDKVAPLIFPWLDEKEVFNCRLVCWRWSRGIDKFLENPLPNGLHLSREASRARTEVTELISKLDKFHLPQDMFKYNWKKFRELATKMENRPLHRNPFIGRKLIFYAGRSPRGSQYDLVWNEAIQFLRNFGDHIWHFTLHYCGRPPFSTQIIIQILSLLPNLKGLEIFPCGDLPLTQAQVAQFQSTIHFPRLEALTVRGKTAGPLAHLIIQRYSQQVTSLLMDYSRWWEEYSQSFPNLTELTLLDCNEHVRNVRNVLVFSNAPQLLRLELELYIGANPHPDQFKSSIASLLQPFQKVISFKVYLELADQNVLGFDRTVGPVSSTPVSITSLKSLSVFIFDKELVELVNFEFLKCFPNLSFIDVDSRCDKRAMDSPTINLYEPSIWEVGLPKLLELNLGEDGRHYKCLTRAKYEWLAKRRT